VEFPEDRAPKKQPEAENTCQEPAPAAEAAVPEPLYKRFEPQKPQPAFKGFRSRGTVAEGCTLWLCDGADIGQTSVAETVR